MEIIADDLEVKFSHSKASLFKIKSFKVSSGSQLLIRGASGKGKTSFLHLLAGLLLPVAGSVKVGNTEITRLSEKQRTLFRRNNIGIVFQKLNLLEHLTALENIDLAFGNDHSKETSLNLLQKIGLQDRAFERASVLSLGEQQRVAIARVVAGKHQVILADEPTSSLDDTNAHEVLRLLKESAAKKTLIVVSHDHRIERHFDSKLNFESLII